MNERIKELRKRLDLTQQEFGSRIGMKRNSIALIEGGRQTSEQTIVAICREFGVNREWLQTGIGDMFLTDTPDELSALAKRYGLTAADCILAEKYLNLKPEIRVALVNFILETAAAMTGGILTNNSSENYYEEAPDTLEELIQESNSAKNRVG